MLQLLLEILFFGKKLESDMKFYAYFFLFISACKSEKDNNKQFIDESIKDTSIVQEKNTDEETSYLENDTTVITLNKVNINLLDIRIDSTSKRKLLVYQGKIIVGEIEIPTQESIQGFAVNWIRENENGFEISVEYGSRYYRQKDFYFHYEGGVFLLKNILSTSFDKHNAESMNSFDKKNDTIFPPVKLNDFNILNYLH